MAYLYFGLHEGEEKPQVHSYGQKKVMAYIVMAYLYVGLHEGEEKLQVATHSFSTAMQHISFQQPCNILVLNSHATY